MTDAEKLIENTRIKKYFKDKFYDTVTRGYYLDKLEDLRSRMELVRLYINTFLLRKINGSKKEYDMIPAKHNLGKGAYRYRTLKDLEKEQRENKKIFSQLNRELSQFDRIENMKFTSAEYQEYYDYMDTIAARKEITNMQLKKLEAIAKEYVATGKVNNDIKFVEDFSD